MSCGARPLKKSEVRRKGSRALGRLAAVFDASKNWQNRTAIPVWLHPEQAERARVDLGALRETVLSGLPPLGVALAFVDDRADAQVRVHFDPGDGNWSYVGRDAQTFSTLKPTMNLANVDQRTVLHEFCHMLGMLHEQSHPDRPFEFREQVVINEMRAAYGWDEGETRTNILDKSAEADATAFDEDSIMMYAIPERWTVGDYELRADELSSALSAGDVAQLQRWYPGGRADGNDPDGRADGKVGEREQLPMHPREKPVPPDAVLWYVSVGVLGVLTLALLGNAAASVFAPRRAV